MSNIKGVFAAGDCLVHYHGAAALAGNRLLAALFSGLQAGHKAWRYAGNLEKGCEAVGEGFFTDELEKQAAAARELFEQSGPENVCRLQQELALVMTGCLAGARINRDLDTALKRILEIGERTARASLADKGQWFNQEAVFARHLGGMTELALAMVTAALLRDESRGLHIKPDYAERNDDLYLKTTKVRWTAGCPEIFYEETDRMIWHPKPDQQEDYDHPFKNQAPGRAG